MEILALVPGLIAAYVAFFKSPQRAFFDVYLPVLVLMPDYYRWIAPGLPDPTFSMAAILPVAIAFLLKEAREWRFSFADFLVIGYAFCVSYSEYLNSGYSDAQNLMFEMLTWVVMPYVLAKGMIEPGNLRVQFARRLVWLFAVICLISVYEFKMGATPWKLLMDRFFPWQGTGWITTFRWGFARVAGPYGHAILAGIILITAYRLQRWLEWSGYWEPKFKRLAWLPSTKARWITGILLAGVIMTMVRGPWMGGFLAAGVTAIGKSKNRWLAVGLTLALLVVIGIPASIAAYSYVSVGRANATSVSQESAAYRKELIDKYVDIAIERSDWGWGRNNWPKVAGMGSIDNYYLLLSLMHGLIALGFLLAIFIWFIARLFWRGMREPLASPPGSSFSFTLLGIFWSIFFSIATVFMGNQLIPLFFLVTGWAEGYLMSNGQVTVPGLARAKAAASPPQFRFRRVLA